MEEVYQNKLAEWVEAYTDDLYKRALFKVSDPEFAKDLVQETFLAASQKISDFKGQSSPKTWLYSILNNKIVDHYRKKGKQPTTNMTDAFSAFFDENKEWKSAKKPEDWHENDQNLLENDEFQRILEDCLEALPQQWNTCVKLKYITNKKGKEICKELDITPSNYWQIIHRAKLQLRDCIETNWFKS